jgi:LL-diaminopimelate aminotransferase
MKTILDRAERFWKVSQSALGPMKFTQKRLKARGANVIDLTLLHMDLPETKSFRESVSKIDPIEFTKPAKENTLTELKETILRYHQPLKDISIEPETEVVIIPGIKIGLTFLALSLLNRGDVAAYPDPGHSFYRSAICLSDGEPSPYILNETADYIANISTLVLPPERKLKMMFVNYPHNPTGAMVDYYFYRDLLKEIKLDNILLVADCAFNHPGDPEAISPLQVPAARKKTIEFHSFSTTFGIRGLGYAIGHRDAVAILRDILQSVGFSIDCGRASIASLAMKNAEAVFNERTEILDRKCELMVNGLKKIGWSLRKPKLTPYIWVKAPVWGSSLAFTRRLFIKAGIRVMSGTDFGEHGEGWIRLSIWRDDEILKESLARISHHSKIWQRKIKSK